LFLFACVVLPHYVVNKDEYNVCFCMPTKGQLTQHSMRRIQMG